MLFRTSSKQIYDWDGLFSMMLITKQRYENLEIWKNSIEIAKDFCCITEKLEELHLDKFSQHLREICIQISNHLAEISTTSSKKNITRSLTNAHLLTLEAENAIMIFYEHDLIDSETNKNLVQKLNRLNKEIENSLSVLCGSK